jgi:hypothetical protein
VTAYYLGDGITTSSVSSTEIHTVFAGTTLPKTNMTLSAQKPLSSGVIDVKVNGGSTPPPGVVTLRVDGGTEQTFTLAPAKSGAAAVTANLGPLAIGTHIVSAVYLGSPTHQGTTAEIEVRVTK